MPPEPELRPHTERSLNADARRVAPLRHGRRPLESWSVVLHLDGVLLGDLEEGLDA